MKKILTATVFMSLAAIFAQEPFKEADSFTAKRDFAGLEKTLSSYAEAAETTASERKEALFRICNAIHWTKPEDYSAIRTAAEKILAIKDVSIMEKKRALEYIAWTFERVRDSVKAAEIREKIVQLPWTEPADIARENYALATLYLHSIRDMEKGGKYMLAALKNMEIQATKLSGIAKADAMMNISYAYRSQLRDKNNADKFARESVNISKSLLSGDPRADSKLLLRMGNACKSMNENEEAEKYFASAAKNYIKITDEASEKAKTDSEWLKSFDVIEAIRIMGANAATAKKALETADRVIAMKDSADDSLRWNAANMADNICLNGPDDTLRKLESKYVNVYVSISKNPDTKARNLLRLGEIYFRKEMDLKKARGIFRYVADDPATPKEHRETALLWLEMLSDAPKK